MLKIDKTFEKSVTKIYVEFMEFLSSLNDSNIRKKYIKMLQNILKVVRYRHRYYVDNIDNVLDMTFKLPDGGGLSTPKKENIPISIHDITQPIYTTSPNKFRALMKNINQCNMKKR